MISSQGCRRFFKKRTHRLWNSILPEPGQPSAQQSKLKRLTACKKTKHTVIRWYMTVYIPSLVASYDTHKGKRWLNSDPPQPQGTIYKFKIYKFWIYSYLKLSLFEVIVIWSHSYLKLLLFEVIVISSFNFIKFYLLKFLFI